MLAPGTFSYILYSSYPVSLLWTWLWFYFPLLIPEYQEFVPTHKEYPWSKDPLPDGWFMLKCPDTGRLYFSKYLCFLSLHTSIRLLLSIVVLSGIYYWCFSRTRTHTHTHTLSSRKDKSTTWLDPRSAAYMKDISHCKPGGVILVIPLSLCILIVDRLYMEVVGLTLFVSSFE